jgi:hypothetical protein
MKRRNEVEELKRKVERLQDAKRRALAIAPARGASVPRRRVFLIKRASKRPQRREQAEAVSA